MRLRVWCQDTRREGKRQSEKRMPGSLDIAMENLDEILGGAGFAGIDFGGFAENVETDFAVDDFDQQAVDGAAAGGNLLQDGGALAVFLERRADAFDLAFDAVDASQELAAFLHGMGHRSSV